MTHTHTHTQAQQAFTVDALVHGSHTKVHHGRRSSRARSISQKYSVSAAAPVPVMQVMTPVATQTNNFVLDTKNNNNNNINNEPKRRRRRKRWPQSYKGIGYSIALFVSMTCAFFVLVYGLKFDLDALEAADNADLLETNNNNGNNAVNNTAVESTSSGWNDDWTVSARWIFSVAISNMQDVFFNNPLSIVISSVMTLFFGGLMTELGCGFCVDMM